MNKYSFSETLTNVLALICTKLFFKQARLIRRPVYIRGREHLDGAEGLTTGYNCRFDLAGEGKTLTIGRNCQFGDNTHIVAHKSVRIGNDVLLASKIFISDTSHGEYNGAEQVSPYSLPRDRALMSMPVEIGDRVWLGENVVVLAGVKIGEGCIVGANSVVTKEIPPNSIAAGIPARVIKKWNEEEKSWIREE